MGITVIKYSEQESDPPSPLGVYPNILIWSVVTSSVYLSINLFVTSHFISNSPNSNTNQRPYIWGMGWRCVGKAMTSSSLWHCNYTSTPKLTVLSSVWPKVAHPNDVILHWGPRSLELSQQSDILHWGPRSPGLPTAIRHLTQRPQRPLTLPSVVVAAQDHAWSGLL